jgi:thioredoxin 1
MKKFRLFLIVFAALAATGASAFTVQPYEKAAVDRAIASGKPVAIEVYASWCLTCLAQASAIDALKDKPEFRNIAFYRVDLDAQKEAVKALDSPRSTIIVYRGGKEIARQSWGASQEDVMKILMKAMP